MEQEYRIRCVPLAGAELSAMMRQFPSPISRPEMREIYNYRIDADGYYLVDRGVDSRVAAVALKLFVDAAFSKGPIVEIYRP
jgi:hypothetical protein